jgi:hypothetical protein
MQRIGGKTETSKRRKERQQEPRRMHEAIDSRKRAKFELQIFRFVRSGDDERKTEMTWRFLRNLRQLDTHYFDDEIRPRRCWEAKILERES